MLVITRKPGQSFSLSVDDNYMEVMVCTANGNQVKIGVTAESKVKILRDDAKKRINPCST